MGAAASVEAAALGRLRQRGVEHGEFRWHRIRRGSLALRDATLESARDAESIGFSVRALHRGCFGFAATTAQTAASARDVADRAVEQAEMLSSLNEHPVVIADEPVHAGVEWVSQYALDPFEVDVVERADRLAELSARLLAAEPVDHADASVVHVVEDTFYADTAGSTITQRQVRIHPELTAVSVHARGFTRLRTIGPATGRGWEYLLNDGWDWDAEIAELPETLREQVRAPSVEPGAYDLVIHPSNLWLTIHETVGHATELDRILGHEAAFAGTSFIAPHDLGRLRYGTPAMHVTGDRTTAHGLATVGFDAEGVAAQEFDLVRGGILVGFQLNRQMAAATGQQRSNGCAYASGLAHAPLQRMPNVSLQPDPAGPSTEELVERVERGILVVGDGSWSIDMQRLNFQFTGQRFYRIANGRMSDQLRDVAYQADTPTFWSCLEATGGPATYLVSGSIDCGKGQPGQQAPVSHGCPSALFRGINVLNTAQESGR